jgi:hypothetical protein
MSIRIDEITAEVPEEVPAGNKQPVQPSQPRSPQQAESTLRRSIRRLERLAARLRVD